MFFTDLSAELRDDIILRRNKLIALLEKNGADALILRTNTNLYYATGKITDGFFYLNASGEARLFMRRPLLWTGEGIVPIRHPAQLPEQLSAEGLPMPSRLMLEEDLLPYAEYIQLLNLFSLTQATTNFMRQARMIKTPYEQKLCREACQWHARTQEGIAQLYRKGMTERDFAIAIEHHFRINGHLGKFQTYGHRLEAYMGSILSGDNADAPSPFDFALGGAGEHPTLPFGACKRKMLPGETVMVDMSGSINGYLSDLSRTYSIGAVSSAARDAHFVSIEIQNEITRHAKPGVPVCDLYGIAMRVAQKHSLTDNFMGLSQRAKFIGHGLGLEINEPPVLTPRDETPLQPGMTIALEPKFVLPGIGPVGTENTYLVTESGMENLTGGVCEDIIEL